MLRGIISLLTYCLLATSAGHAQSEPEVQRNFQDKFRQLGTSLPTPNMFRNASGAPGSLYWQQKVDYRIEAILNDQTQTLTGTETITYTNNSPDTLRYLWIQLDQNRFNADSIANLTLSAHNNETLSYKEARFEFERDFGGGYNIKSVKGMSGGELAHTIVGTMMRIDLPEPLGPGQKYRFSIDWNFKIADAKIQSSRSGYEYFEDDDNWIYEVAQWYPRLAVYSDVYGWQNKQFVTAEFALEFGDFKVSITVPNDHIVAATGELQNGKDVLSAAQRERLAGARSADSPTYIVTPEEAEANESSEASGTKTWVFRSENVRDFAWASSRKFIWDAQGHELEGNFTMAMSFWPKEGEPLWSQYSTHAIMQALDVYGGIAFPMPYPVMISVNGPVGGMEYPMITFNGARPEDDGTYGKRTKYGLISVIIHEVGHSWFPMIVNSDERQWVWMDEGVNTFVQFIAEQEWETDYPSRRGEPRAMLDYFRDPDKVPIMTNSDSVLQLGNNAYGKAATALNILRETVLGRELFDSAFKEYANRWKFKKPEPSDLFRTLENASGVDLDWFWRGWFYTTDYTDQSIKGITRYTMDTGDPDVDREKDRAEDDEEPQSISQLRNADISKRVERHPELEDFYNEFDEFEVFEEDRDEFQEMVAELTDRELEIMDTNHNYYVVDLESPGGLAMPAILKVTYADGSTDLHRYPAEIWRYDTAKVGKMLITDKEIVSLELDPYQETGDVDTENNHFPRKIQEERFLVKPKDEKDSNPIQEEIEREIGDEEEEEKE